MGECKIMNNNESTGMIGDSSWSMAALEEMAKLHDGKVIQIISTTPKLRILWECNKGDRWDQEPGIILMGSWCPNCERRERARKKKEMAHPTKTVKVPHLFNGGTGKLFAFDMNNLATSWKKRFPKEDILYSDFSMRIVKILPNSTGNYMSYFYASIQYQNLMRKFPINTHNHWYIEDYQKNCISQEIMDIDPTLTGEISQILRLYSDQISHFYLGSGDLDLHIVVDIARSRKIPITVIAFDENTLNHKLANLANSVELLY
jgi:hypothetical protein